MDSLKNCGCNQRKQGSLPTLACPPRPCRYCYGSAAVPVTGENMADILEGGAIGHLLEEDSDLTLDVAEEDEVVSGPADNCTRLTIDVAPEYDPSHHYPPNILSLLFGGTTGNSLEDRFSLLRLLQSLPAKKTIPRSHFDSLYYRGEAPTADMRCPQDDADMRAMTASERAIHLHNCTIKARQLEADKLQEVRYPMPVMCPWNNCRHRPTDFKKWKKHLHRHFHVPMENQRKVRCQITGCSKEGFLYNMDDVRRHVTDDNELTTEARGLVEFCYWCHDWYMSHVHS